MRHIKLVVRTQSYDAVLLGMAAWVALLINETLHESFDNPSYEKVDSVRSWFGVATATNRSPD